ncbi:DUF3575 domain-containing protein [Parabacteroides sp. Marseille-P3160]|uniref:DUF3575 domain-containing protein n=1 Tax=Parabacteroides sp. Marseille-P3160 TaxID=1917887 RepID=UPI0009B9BA3A|nr:DUF3575 domain-containing protein [Parabacteroides sp. Marseille-P3160]
MKRTILLFSLLIYAGNLFPQSIALKNNLLYSATATPNLGLEIGIAKHFSVDLTGGYHPWSFTQDKSLQHWIVQPEFRYWFLERFDGHYLGFHAQYADYDLYGFDLPWGMDKEYAYDGHAIGGGLSYGYHLYLTSRWNMEFTIGGGYNQFRYLKYTINNRGEKDPIGDFKRDYFGLTKIGISLVYLIK